MKIIRLHKILLLLLVMFQIQISFAYFQNPPQQKRFDENFKERYSGKKYDYEGRKIVNKTPKGSGDFEDYNSKDPKVREINDNGFTINLGPLSWLFYLAIIAAIIYLVYILLNEGGAGLFTSKSSKKLDTIEDITSENIENADIDALINRAENDLNFRLAIRYYYLLVLKTLSLKNHIKFEDDKTNAEYLNELSAKPFSGSFAYTSYLYNYIWYGEFPLDFDKYTKAKANFVTLLNQVK